MGWTSKLGKVGKSASKPVKKAGRKFDHKAASSLDNPKGYSEWQPTERGALVRNPDPEVTAPPSVKDRFLSELNIVGGSTDEIKIPEGDIVEVGRGDSPSVFRVHRGKNGKAVVETFEGKRFQLDEQFDDLGVVRSDAASPPHLADGEFQRKVDEDFVKNLRESGAVSPEDIRVQRWTGTIQVIGKALRYGGPPALVYAVGQAQRWLEDRFGFDLPNIDRGGYILIGWLLKQMDGLAERFGKKRAPQKTK